MSHKAIHDIYLSTDTPHKKVFKRGELAAIVRAVRKYKEKNPPPSVFRRHKKQLDTEH